MYLAIDIGGTKTLVATIKNNGVIAQRLKFPTAKDYPTFIRNLSDTVAYLSTQEFIAAGVGIPGRIDRKTGIGIGMGNLPWRHVPIKKDITRLARANTVIENDAKLAALSEAMLLKDRYNRVLYITIGTGIGGGLIVDQKIDTSLQDSEPGKMPLEYQGKMQAWEDFAAGRAIVKNFGKPASEITDKAIWAEIAHKLAVGLIDVLAVVQPQVVVLGGGIGTYFEQYKQPLIDELKSYETPLIPVPPILQAQRPEDAVLYGCYDLAESTHGKNHQSIK